MRVVVGEVVGVFVGELELRFEQTGQKGNIKSHRFDTDGISLES